MIGSNLQGSVTSDADQGRTSEMRTSLSSFVFSKKKKKKKVTTSHITKQTDTAKRNCNMTMLTHKLVNIKKNT